MIPIFLMTYNCNKQPFDEDRFIPDLEQVLPDEPALLFVFGVQEMCSILDGSFHDTSLKHLIQYNEALLEALRNFYNQPFQTVDLVSVGAIGLIAISPYALKFTDVRLARAGVGKFNSSMKGAVGLRVRYLGSKRDEETEITFASAHLSAFEGEYYYLKRNNDVHQIFRSLHFDDGYGLLKPKAHTFFMGDLNYRTTKTFLLSNLQELFELMDHSLRSRDGEADDESITIPTSTDSIQRLVNKYDELTEARKNNEVFIGFSEPPICFPPTYKYNIGTAIFNNKRSPSWCDRILYQSTYIDGEFALLDSKKRKEQLKKYPKIYKYDSIPAKLSDHQPVYLHISIPIEAPQLIVSPQGFLQILPTLESSDDWISPNVISSGPTEIFIQPNKYDDIVQEFLRPTADFFIGWGLWFSTVARGRMTLILILILMVAEYYYMRPQVE